MSGIQKQKTKQNKKKRVVVTVAQKAAALLTREVAHANAMVTHTKNQKRSMRNLSNRRGGTGRLGLSSTNKSSTRLKQVIEEDEYIADVNGSVAFATTQYNVNPGQSSTFPWASKLSALFEKYHFDELEFYYRREVSEYATNGQSGKVMLSFDYDASDAPPSNKQQVLDTIPHADGMPCIPTLRLVINTNEMKQQDGWYVRTGAQPANTDIKTYDCGVLSVSTYGCANTTPIGELRVRYRCTLHVPVLEAVGGPANQPGSYFEITSALVGETAAATTVYGPQFASATAPSVIANSIQATITSAGLITLLPGVYKIEAACLSSDPSGNVTAGTIKLCQVTTANTDVIYGYGSAGFATGSIPTYTSWEASTTPFILNTGIFGVNVCLQVAATYAAGVCSNNSYLKITTL